MSEVKAIIWERNFQLEVEFGCYPGESILDSQQEALKWFLNKPAALELSKKNVEAYLMKDNPDKFPDDTVDNIFKYVMPRSIFIPHDKKHQTVAIMCDYKFDIEHGLAIVFEDSKLTRIGVQDIIL